MKVLKGHEWEVGSGRAWDVKLGPPQKFRLGRLQDVRLGRPEDDQIVSLGDILERLEEYIFGTSWEPIFSGWVLSIHILYV